VSGRSSHTDGEARYVDRHQCSRSRRARQCSRDGLTSSAGASTIKDIIVHIETRDPGLGLGEGPSKDVWHRYSIYRTIRRGWICAIVQEQPARAERRLSAILAADVAGYSRLMGRTRRVYPSASVVSAGREMLCSFVTEKESLGATRCGSFGS
jgi:hypothetical protein